MAITTIKGNQHDKRRQQEKTKIGETSRKASLSSVSLSQKKKKKRRRGFFFYLLLLSLISLYPILSIFSYRKNRGVSNFKDENINEEVGGGGGRRRRRRRKGRKETNFWTEHAKNDMMDLVNKNFLTKDARKNSGTKDARKNSGTKNAKTNFGKISSNRLKGEKKKKNVSRKVARIDGIKYTRKIQNIAGDSKYRYVIDDRNGTAGDNYDDDVLLLTYGFVMREFVNRIFTSKTPRSNVIILVDNNDDNNEEDTQAQKKGQTTTTDGSQTANKRKMDNKNNNNNKVGWNILERARKDGHKTYSLGVDRTTGKPLQNIDEWWSKKIETETTQAETTMTNQRQQNQYQQPLLPNEFLLGFFDLRPGMEDEMFYPPSSSSSFLGENEGPKISYIVLGVTSSMRGPFYSSDEPVYTFGGMKAVQRLLQNNYKIQVLSMTDYWNGSLSDPFSFELIPYRPNEIIDMSNVENFFEMGARSAAFSQAYAADPTKSTDDVGVVGQKSIFKSYLFATHGLDLAIPSRMEFVDGGTFAVPKIQLDSIAPTKSSIQSAKIEMVKAVPFAKCEKWHDRVRVEFKNSIDQKSMSGEEATKTNQTTTFHPLDVINVYCQNIDVTSILKRGKLLKKWVFQIWMNKNDASSAEAFCVKLDCNFYQKSRLPTGNEMIRVVSAQVDCVTRIVRQQPPLLPSSFLPSSLANSENMRNFNANGSNSIQKPNILVVTMDSISRDQFDFMLPRTKSILKKLAFQRFDKYTTVSNRSDINKAALYTGDFSVLHDDDDNDAGGGNSNGSNGGEAAAPPPKQLLRSSSSLRWIWDELGSAGYTTFKANDGCIDDEKKSYNRVHRNRRLDDTKTTSINATHGNALKGMYCYYFKRPNCVGRKLAADHLMTHAKQFIEEYSFASSLSELDNNQPPKQQPWAAFLSLTDSNEDTMTLSGILDKPLEDFLLWMSSSSEPHNKIMSNTLVVLVSDNGMDRGSYFQSKKGEKERSEPILYVKLPQTTGDDGAYGRNLLANANKWITPFDVHETIMEIALEGSSSNNNEHPTTISKLQQTGVSLVKNMSTQSNRCQDVGTIPDKHCQLLEENNDKAPKKTQQRATNIIPPSVSSFFADIPRDQRLKQFSCKEEDKSGKALFDNIKDKEESCKCSTKSRDWYSCKRHPWTTRHGFPTLSGRNSSSLDFFALVDCPEAPLSVETRIKISKEEWRQIQKRKENKSSSIIKSSSSDSPPNILFLEVDSVSVQYADRHFPLTRELLKKHRIDSSSESGDDNGNGNSRIDGNNGTPNNCRDGLCAIEFPLFAAVGPNSIANQMAALSGCITASFHRKCFGDYGGVPTIGAICSDKSRFEFGMRLHSDGPGLHLVYCPINDIEKPFLYDVAKKEGYFTFFGEEFCYEGSPWVAQDFVFPLRADILLHKIFCRITRRENPKEKKLYKRDIYGSGMQPQPCADFKTRNSIDKQKIGLQLIRQMWDANNKLGNDGDNSRNDTPPPKFVYLNAMAAHHYTRDPARATIAAEAYDELLSSFLQSFFQRDDAHNTIIVVRSDHGFQGGQSRVLDYSTQVEHSRPWTEIIVPDRYPMERLIENRNKLMTSYDLYHTLRDFVTSNKNWNNLYNDSGDSMDSPPGGSRTSNDRHFNGANVTQWSYNILTESIPNDRSCEEAKIPSDFCPFEEPRPPKFGTCNEFEARQAIFCRNMNEQFIRTIPCQLRPEGSQLIAYQKYLDYFEYIDKIVSAVATTTDMKLPSKEEIIHPRQSTILFFALYEFMNKQTKRVRVCIGGFGSGHSTALFLMISNLIDIVVFDRFQEKYQRDVLATLNEEFGDNRIISIVGDPCQTIPNFFSDGEQLRCDHSYESAVCQKHVPLRGDGNNMAYINTATNANFDTINSLVRYTLPQGIVSSTLTTSVNNDTAIYFGEGALWGTLQQKGCLSNPVCWEEEIQGLEEPYEFCMATSKHCSLHNSNFIVAQSPQASYTRYCSKVKVEVTPVETADLLPAVEIKSMFSTL